MSLGLGFAAARAADAFAPRIYTALPVPVLEIFPFPDPSVAFWCCILIHKRCNDCKYHVQNVHRERGIKMSEEAAPKALNMLHCNLLVIGS